MGALHEAVPAGRRAGRHAYVETGLWWRELYERPLIDPNIGPSKLLWGTDGASMQIYSQLGRRPPSYAVQLRDEGIPHYQVDYWGWSLRELTGLRISQDDMNLILGGTRRASSDSTCRTPACSRRRPTRSDPAPKNARHRRPIDRVAVAVQVFAQRTEGEERSPDARTGA